MKIRQGFVSNSSSSSFIVATQDSTKVMFEVDLADLGGVATTREELDVLFMEHLGGSYYDTVQDFLDESEWYEERYRECLEALGRGEKIVAGRVSNDSYNSLNTLVYTDGIPATEGITVIQEVR